MKKMLKKSLLKLGMYGQVMGNSWSLTLQGLDPVTRKFIYEYNEASKI